jgi:hypothetical protein
MHRLMLALAMLLPLAAPVTAGERPDFADRLVGSQPLRFTDAAGNVFRPRSLIVMTDAGAARARLPAAVDDIRSEAHVDLSGTPLFGHLFKRRLAPGDAAREGQPVGPLSRIGDALVLDARGGALPLGALRLVMTANFPRDGAVSYHLGRLNFTPAAPPEGVGRPAGAAYRLDGTLVLAGAGREPLIQNWGEVLRPRP